MSPATPNLGRYGSFGYGVQTAVGTAATLTNWLRVTAFTNPEVTVTRTRDNYANGSIFQQQERTQGRRFDGRTLSFEADLGNLRALASVFGTPVATVAQTVTIGSGGAAKAATTVPVTALTAALTSGTLLAFGSNVVVLSANAAQGATSLTTFPLAAAVTAGQTASLAVGSTITPRTNNFATNAPNTPITFEQVHPAVNVRGVDSQISMLSLTVANRATVTGSITLGGFDITHDYTPASAVLPTADVLRFDDHYIRYGDTIFRPESSSITINTPMEILDAARGLDLVNSEYGYGFERSGTDGVSLSVSFTEAGYNATLRDAYREGTTAEAAYGFLVGGKVFEFRLRAAEVNSVEVPGGLERVAVPYTLSGVQTDGLAPWSIYTV